MTELQRLEHDVLEINGRITLRPTLDLARQVGEKLIEARPLVPHGQWLHWLRRVYLTPRVAQLYVMLAKSELHSHSGMTITDFLRLIRVARRAASRAQIQEQRDQAAASRPRTDPAYQIVHADCRQYRWPERLDLVATDPPWDELDHYRWLGGFARGHLRPGGLLLAQCGTRHLAEVVTQFRDSGLTYQWVLALVYPDLHAAGSRVVLPWQASWRPVVVASNGPIDRTGVETVCDTHTVDGRSDRRQHHPHEQPLGPWLHWLGRLTRPGDLVGDPYCGGGTIPVALKQIGGRHCLATEIDLANVRVARARLAKTVEGSFTRPASGA